MVQSFFTHALPASHNDNKWLNKNFLRRLSKYEYAARPSRTLSLITLFRLRCRSTRASRLIVLLISIFSILSTVIISWGWTILLRWAIISIASEFVFILIARSSLTQNPYTYVTFMQLTTISKICTFYNHYASHHKFQFFVHFPNKMRCFWIFFQRTSSTMRFSIFCYYIRFLSNLYRKIQKLPKTSFLKHCIIDEITVSIQTPRLTSKM